jgi:hypothetical protein
MDEFRAEGRGVPDDHSVIGHYLRDRQGAWSTDEGFVAFAEEVRAFRLEDTPRPEGFVPVTELWLVEGDAFLGRVGIRHRLTQAPARDCRAHRLRRPAVGQAPRPRDRDAA